MTQHKAIFLDRDGVVNEVVYHNNIPKPSSPWNITEFKLIKNIQKNLETLSHMGFLLFIISNQPDIARGNIQKGTTEKINKILYEKLPITDIKICPHDYYHHCTCRKPKPGMIFELTKKWNIDLKQSFLIGDSWKDVQAAKNANINHFLIGKPYNTQVNTKHRIKNLEEAIALIKKNTS